ncbi:hypothetical protein H2200_010638 [Cladophialophora chaetospira]|uniref:Uncharacterized protein n=1 Tax=Cladophialophora chaetospira TaxID=386627 RepID=A0AA38X0I8_9EURO|nr:hypothetical protein H2200_010638 [Cladophialophora chaetospira]
MDEALLRVYAAQNSQEKQMINAVLNKSMGPAQSTQVQAAALAELTHKDNWRWRPQHGLQVGIPQDSGVKWKARESVNDIKNRIRPTTLSDGDPDPNSNRTMFRQDFVWTMSQVLHYGLGFATTRRDAAALIAKALLQGDLEQPAELFKLGRILKAEFKAQEKLKRSERRQQVAATEVNALDEDAAGDTIHAAGYKSQSIHSKKGEEVIPSVLSLSEKARGKQREASIDISEISENEEEELEDSELDLGEAGPLSDNHRSTPQVSPALRSRSPNSFQGETRHCSSQETKSIKANLKVKKNTPQSRSWVCRLPKRFTKPKAIQEDRAASPPLQVIGEGKVNGCTQWYPAHHPLSSWRWGGRSAQPAYVRDGIADPAGESAGDAIIVSDDDTPVRTETTACGLKRRRVVTNSRVSSAANGRFIFSIPPSEPPARPCQHPQGMSSARAGRRAVFPAAKTSTGQTLGSTKAKNVAPTDMRSIDRSTSDAQNKDVLRKNKRKKQRLSSEPSEAVEADNAPPLRLAEAGLSTAKPAPRPLLTSTNSKSIESTREPALDCATAEPAADIELTGKRVGKKGNKPDSTTSKTGNPANGTTGDPLEDNSASASKKKPACVNTNSKSVTAKKKSASAAAPGPESVLPTPPTDDEAPIPPQAPATRMVSLPPLSEMEASPVGQLEFAQEAKVIKTDLGLFYGSDQEYQDMWPELIALFKKNHHEREHTFDDFHAWMRRIIELFSRHLNGEVRLMNVSAIRDYLASSANKKKSTKRSLATAFENVAETSKPPKSTKKSKKAGVGPNSEVEVTDDLEPESDDETTNDTTSDAAPKTVPPGTTVHESPKTRYVLDYDKNGVPARRPPFRRSPGASKTIRDQLGKPIDPKAVIRNESRLDVILARDPETLRREAITDGVRHRRGALANHSPPRSGKILTMMPNLGKGKARTKKTRKANGKGKGKGKAQTKELGKGIYHKHTRSAKMPMKRFSIGGMR